MGPLSIWHWIVFVVVVMLLFSALGHLRALQDDLRRGMDPYRRSLGDLTGDPRHGWKVSNPRPPVRRDWYWPIVLTIGLALLGFLLWQWSGWPG